MKSLSFKNYLSNASGILSNTPFLLKIWEESGVGCVVTKSITYKERNPNPFSYDDKHLILLRGKNYTINSIGLQNKGFKWWKKELKWYRFDIPLIISIATIDELKYVQKMINQLEEYADMFEINVSCPNVKEKIIGYELPLLEELITSISSSIPISIKLPCYYINIYEKITLPSDPFTKKWYGDNVVLKIPLDIDYDMIIKILDMFNDYDIKYVTSHNTVPVFHPTISRRCGLSGNPIHELSVKQASIINEKSNINIFASGGVYNGKDVCDFINMKNVKLVQLGSGLFKYENPEIFINKINEELNNIK